jgi:L-galactose dehydrogenase/L-glyceraldehyde 3-phosphate reductase
MNTRDFGRTGLRVSELVFGGGAVGGLLIHASDSEKRAAIRRALEAGINWIDTAPSYGNGASESALGWLLEEVEGDPGLRSPHVSTKVTIDTGDLRDIPGQIERSLEQSLRRLHKSRVTLLQLHNPIGRATRGRLLGCDEILRDGGVLDGFERLCDRGWIEHFGITALGETPAILDVIREGRVASAQVYFNLLNPSAARALPDAWPTYDFAGVLEACRAHGVAAMNIRVLSAGVIATDTRTGREAPLTPGDTVESESAKARALFAELGLELGSRAQTAIRFALAHDFACVVVGLAELAHLEEALAGSARGPLSASELARIESIYAKGVGDEAVGL